MIVASGFVEANQELDMPGVADALRGRGFEVGESSGAKIVFLIEGESAAEVRKRIDDLQDLPGVRNVYLAYFSLEGADQEPLP